MALLSGLAVYFLTFLLVRIPVVPAPPVRFPSAYVHYVGSSGTPPGAALSEQALLFDSEPLFFPTVWNFASRPVQSPRVRPEPVFGDYAINVSPPGENGLSTTPAGPPPGPVVALQPGQWSVLDVLGEAPGLAPKLPARGALLHVTRLTADSAPAAGLASVVLEETWPVNDAPGSTQNLQALWGPATFLLLFSDTGAVGEPLLVNSSGIFAVDDDLRARLDARFRRKPLPAGTYQAVVGP